MQSHGYIYVSSFRTKANSELHDFNYSSNLTGMLELEGQLHPSDHPSLTKPVWTRWEWLGREKGAQDSLCWNTSAGITTQLQDCMCVWEREKECLVRHERHLVIRLENCCGGFICSAKQVHAVTWHLKRADVMKGMHNVSLSVHVNWRFTHFFRVVNV